MRAKYSEELGAKICDRLADGETLTAICKSGNIPSERTVRSWASDPDHPFSRAYDKAREVGYHKMADDILDIADGAGPPERDRLRVDTRKWLLSKALPKIYGEKVGLKHDATNAFAEVWRAIGNGATPGGDR